MDIGRGRNCGHFFAIYHMSTLKKCQHFLKLSTCIPFDPVIAFLDIYLKDTFIWAQHRYTGMFTAAPFPIAPNCKLPKYPLACLFRIDKYIVVFPHHGTLCSMKMNKLQLHAIIRMDITRIVLKEKKARQREVHIFWFHSHKLQKQAKSIYSVRNQGSGYLRNKGLEMCTRQRGDLKGAGHVLFLDPDAY